MVTNRKPIVRPRKAKITAEMIELFRRGEKIRKSKRDREEWEADGGRRREFLDIDGRLSELLKRYPHECSPFDTIPPAATLLSFQTWPEIQELRRQLLEAAFPK